MTGRASRAALLLGPGATDDGPASSADHDLAAVGELLTSRFGYAADELYVLRGTAADRAGILHGLDRLRDRCAPQGQVVVYFTGHGASHPDAGDAWGEQAALEPHGATSRADLIGDDVLLDWVQSLWATTTDVHLLIDSCFSGGMDADDVTVGAGPGRAYEGGSGWPADTRYALLASSRWSLTSATATFPELRGRPHSLLTGCLVSLLSAWTGPLPTYAELRTLLDARTAARGTAQQPQASGDVHRQVLSKVRRPSRRLVRLAGPQALRAGSVHGVVPGSRWCARTTGEVAAGHEPGRDADGVELEVVDVDPLGSTCRPVGAAAATWSDSAARDVVAEEVARPVGLDGCLRVVLRHAPWLSGPPPPALVARLVQTLGASPLLAVSDDGVLDPFRDDLPDADVVLAHGGAYVTAVCDGVLATRLHDCGSDASLGLLGQDLEEIARWRLARDVEGGGGVRLELFCAPAGTRDFAELAEDPLLTPGDVLAARVTNDGDRRLWPTLFHLGMDCAVVRLFPRTPQNRPLEPGQTRYWGLGGAGGWTVERVAHGNDRRWPQPRRQTVKVWATHAETDLAVLEATPAVALAAGIVPVHDDRLASSVLRIAPGVDGASRSPVALDDACSTAARHYRVRAAE